jgi:hypothetical protein
MSRNAVWKYFDIGVDENANAACKKRKEDIKRDSKKQN